MVKRGRANQTRPAANARNGSGIPRPWSEFLGVALLALGALAIGGLLSYQFGDGDLMGPVGGLMAGALYSVFGMAAYLVALGVIGLGVKALVGDDVDIGAIEGLGFCGATIAGCILLHVSFPEHRVHGFTVGGLLGEILGEIGLGLFGVAGTYILGLAVLCVGLLASTPSPSTT